MPYAYDYRTRQYELCCSKACLDKCGEIRTVPTETPVEVTKLPYLKKASRRKKAGRIRKRTRNSSRFYQSQAWKALRYEVLQKYGRVCMLCGYSRGPMHVDHIKPRSQFPDLALRFDNLQVLCEMCNQGKAGRYHDDFRPSTIKLQ